MAETNFDEEMKNVLEKLSEKELRMTPQRILISKTILSMVKNHSSLKEIYDETQKVLPRVGMSTVYNTIKMLEALKIIDTFDVDGKMRIDQTFPHINIYCRNEDKIIDLDENAMEEITKILAKYGVNMNIKKILIDGKCIDS
ncbi:Fe2+/Zn2+ uptake regulation protein [Caldisphaera lagunensis DSM 15908]|uniref:Fe2+/Zn2+ uptake regulation protein n=1 Tax=Caldisphaera lagunensis (strain DSM 15908 / JCM 11604 / ANMR 0165 / IC-154) TaxID=1056495 RepID=L0ACU2_CALLD|nr:transcriptional repressor [Caldisphaera lagunensis]AFZ70962.1 Fe2+/Zn2+ uptake regulation protein [Caldisphaera lagunensis DSM 15908]